MDEAPRKQGQVFGLLNTGHILRLAGHSLNAPLSLVGFYVQPTKSLTFSRGPKGCHEYKYIYIYTLYIYYSCLGVVVRGGTYPVIYLVYMHTRKRF